MGKTALIYAACDGHENCVLALLEAGADVNKQDTESKIAYVGNTALIHAVDRGCGFPTVSLLLRSGAKINQTSRNNHKNALTHHLNRCNPDKSVSMLLYAAGETIDKTKVQVPGFLKEINVEPSGLSLSRRCRETIRKHLIELDPHENLFHRVPRLGLPSALMKYLLYNVSLDYDSVLETIPCPHCYNNCDIQFLSRIGLIIHRLHHTVKMRHSGRTKHGKK